MYTVNHNRPSLLYRKGIKIVYINLTGNTSYYIIHLQDNLL